MTERPAGYRTAPQIVWDKEIDHLDQHCRAFIALSPWATLSTADADGFPEVSPRGGRPGFVEVLDDRLLALPDRPGNNRIDSLRNVLVNPRIALMFVVPGIEETLRVYGTAAVREPDEVAADLTEFGRSPKSVLVVDVQRAYFQCAKSLMRAGLWEPEQWPGRGDFASIGQVWRDHCGLPAPLPSDEVMRADMVSEL